MDLRSEFSEGFLEDPTRTLTVIEEGERAAAEALDRFYSRLMDTIRQHGIETSGLDSLYAKIDLLAINEITPVGDSKANHEHGMRFAEEVLRRTPKEIANKAKGRAINRLISTELGGDLATRQKEWNKIWALIQSRQDAFSKLSSEVSMKIRMAISEGVVLEKDQGKIMREIMETAAMSKSRAQMIVRTETMRAVNAGVKARYKTEGVHYVEWLAALDERTCEVDLGFPGGEAGCGGLDGAVFLIDKAPACPAHPNCRCTLIPSMAPPEGEGDMESSLYDWEDEVRADDFETARVVTPEGIEVFTETQHEPHSVNFTGAQNALMKGNILSHNHPSGGSLSEADARVAHGRDLEEIRAVGTLKSTGQKVEYVIKRPTTGWKSWYSSKGPADDYDILDNEVGRELMRKATAGEITNQQANDAHMHEIWTRMSRLGHFIYERRFI